jgi:polar amino acid transport system substrate-binding protein
MSRNLDRRSFLIGSASAGLVLTGLVPMSSLASSGFQTISPGELTVAIAGDMPMTGIKDGKLVGTDGEMIVAIAGRLGLDIKPVLMEWSATLESVRTGRADALLGNMKWAPARAKVLAITDAIYYGGTYITMRKDKALEKVTIADLSGHTLGTLTAISIVPELKKVPGLSELRLYDTTDGCVRDVIAGRVDFAVLDAPTVDYIVQQNPGWDLKQVPLLYDAAFPLATSKRPSAIGLNQGNPDLFDAVNAGVKWLWRTKLNARLLTKYGVTNPDYLVPPQTDPRIGVDRDTNGNPIGAGGHTPKNYASLFA